MNKQEQQVVNVLKGEARGMAICEELNLKVITEVAHEITAIFQPTQKDTRSRRERALDAEFERMGVKPKVWHFTDVPPFRAITIAQKEGHITWGELKAVLETRIENSERYTHKRASFVLKQLQYLGLRGIAICVEQDVFSRRYGRMKAKGKLIQHLLKVQKK